MHSIKSTILLLTCFLLLFSSCEFEPSEFFENPVNRDVTPPYILTNSNFLKQDTIIVNQDLDIDFNFKSSDQEILQIQFFVNNNKIFTTDNRSDTLSIKLDEIKEGINTLKAILFTSSGTGSIASSINAEGFQLENNWILIGDKEGFTKVSEAINKGFMQINWFPYYGSESYEVIRYYPNGDSRKWTTNNTHIIDSTYVGEICNYNIYAIRSDKREHWARIDIADKRIPQFNITADKENNYFLKIIPNKYYNAIGHYNLTDVFGPVYTQNDFINDTTIALKDVYFGSINDFELMTHPKYRNISNTQNNYYYTHSGRVNIGYPFNINDFESSEAWFIDDNLILLKERYSDSFIIYSLKDEKIIRKFNPTGACSYLPSGSPKISTTGNSLMFADECGNMHFYYRSDNYTTDNMIKFPIASSIKNYYISGISDNGLVTYFKKFGSDGFSVFDIKSQKVIATYPQQFVKSASISSSGRYINTVIDSLRIIEFDGDGFECLFSASKTDYEDINIRSHIEGEFSLMHKDGITIKYCSDLTTKKEINIPDMDYLRGIDYKTNTLWHILNGKAIFRKFDSDEILLELDFTPYGSYLTNNKLVDTHQMIIYFLPF